MTNETDIDPEEIQDTFKCHSLPSLLHLEAKQLRPARPFGRSTESL